MAPHGESVFGKQKLKYTPLTDITRQDANDLRDHLLSRVSANSAVRMLGVVRTAINHVIVEHSLTIPNVFTNLKIKGAGATKHDRLPLSDDQVVTLETAFSSDDTAWALYVTLRDTGARVSEVSGLRVKDCDLGQQCLHLIATPWRSLKTNNSERSVPLSHTAAAALAKLATGVASRPCHVGQKAQQCRRSCSDVPSRAEFGDPCRYCEPTSRDPRPQEPELLRVCAEQHDNLWFVWR